AGEGAIGANPLARDGGRDVASRDVFRNVAGLEPRHHNVGNARLLERRDFLRADQRALLEHQRALADRMDGNTALRLGDRDGAQLHDAFSNVCSGAFSAILCGPWRSRAVISPMIATAISAGDTAPIGSPIGAWMRARSASARPCALRRSIRRACVFFEPSA